MPIVSLKYLREHHRQKGWRITLTGVRTENVKGWKTVRRFSKRQRNKRHNEFRNRNKPENYRTLRAPTLHVIDVSDANPWTNATESEAVDVINLN